MTVKFKYNLLEIMLIIGIFASLINIPIVYNMSSLFTILVALSAFSYFVTYILLKIEFISLDKAVKIGMLILFIETLNIAPYSDISTFLIAWIVLFPIISHSLLAKRLALRYSALQLVVFILMYMLDIYDESYTAMHIVSIISIYLVVIIISYFTAKHSEENTLKLNKKNDELNSVKNELQYVNSTLIAKVTNQVQEITKSTVLFQIIFDTVKDGIAIIDLKSNFLLVNNAYEKITGMSKESLYNTSCVNLSAPNYIDQSRDVINQALNDGHYFDYKKQCILENDKIIDVIIDMIVMDDKKSIMLVVKDVTQVNIDYKEKRSQEKKIQEHSRLAQMGEMINMIAHQWRQPLGAISTSIIGIQTKLAMGQFDFNKQDERELFLDFVDKKYDNINESVRFLSETIDDFRNFFKPDKKKELISLISPIKRALYIIEASMQSKNIQIIKEFECDEEVEIYQNELMQVILNLFKNSEDNFIERNIENRFIKIKTYIENDSCIIDVIDNGGGIFSDVLSKIYDPYFSTKNEKNGTGLGLYMSKIIIQEHNNGSLSANNTDNGVCFKIELPRKINV